MKLKHYILSIAIIGLSACAGVEPTKESSGITLVKPFNVKNCLKLGTTNASVSYKIDIVTLDENATTERLITVAKNRAAELGGDSIVAKGPVSEGKMSFDIYKCAE